MQDMAESGTHRLQLNVLFAEPSCDSSTDHLMIKYTQDILEPRKSKNGFQGLLAVGGGLGGIST